MKAQISTVGGIDKLKFTAVAKSVADMVTVPAGYTAQVVVALQPSFELGPALLEQRHRQADHQQVHLRHAHLAQASKRMNT